MKVKLYIEGGGDGSHLDALFRQGWSNFFEKAGLKGRMPRVVRGGGRRQTWKLFSTAVARPKEGELPLLLLDSEEPVPDGQSVWGHLSERPNDRLAKPTGAAEQHAFLMICVMETWFLADPATLKAYFGQHFREEAIPKREALEQMHKIEVFKALERATASCGPRRYDKGETSFRLLHAIDPTEVEKLCPAAKRLLDRLRNI